MNYYYVLVHYVNPIKIKDYHNSMLSGHIVKAESLKEAQRITEKHGIANPFHSKNIKRRSCRRLDMRLKHNKETIRRRLCGKGGNIWHEENGKLQKELTK